MNRLERWMVKHPTLTLWLYIALIAAIVIGWSILFGSSGLLQGASVYD